MARETEKEEKKDEEKRADTGTITTETSPEGAGTRTTSGTGTETGEPAGTTGTGKEKEEKEKLSGLVDVTDEEKEKILKAKKKAGIISDDEKKELRRLSKNRRDRERYEKEKAEREEAGISQPSPIPVVPGESKPEPAKPKRRRATRKKKLDTEQVENLLYAVFNFISTKEDFEHWKMTKTEAKEIAVPLCEVLEKYDKLSGLTNNSSEIGLVIAVASFVIPNMIITINKRKEKKKDGTKGVAVGSVGGKLDEKRPSKPRVKTDSKPVAVDRSGNVENSGIFGSPLV